VIFNSISSEDGNETKQWTARLARPSFFFARRERHRPLAQRWKKK
jgi:hypothetical protein